jgi:secondary thiamine-phosphate synthase enzyme
MTKFGNGRTGRDSEAPLCPILDAVNIFYGGWCPMLDQYSLQTSREGFTNITEMARRSLKKSGVQEGVCLVYCPHTTAGITINENADPHVVHDILLGLSKALPDRPEFLHAEGNSAAHLKASCMGSSAAVPVQDGQLVLGIWQGIYFCEFDGPRERHFFVKIISG